MICHRNARHICGILILAGIVCSIAAWVASAAAPLVPAARTVIPPGDRAGKEERVPSLSDRLQPLPASYRVQKHYDDRYTGRTRETRGEQQIIYSNTNGQFLFRLGFATRIADDLITTLAGSCAVNTLRLRVSGGVEGGGGIFAARVRLFDGCPASDEGTEISGSFRQINDLDDDIAILHELVLDYSDRGICDDLSACEVSQQNCADDSVCVENPLQIPPTVWVQILFNSNDAAIVMGSPPTIGFSADGYADLRFGFCTAFFGGWPSLPHASVWAELTVPSECGIHFLAYSAADPDGLAFLPTNIAPPNVGTQTTRLGDDIQLSVDECIVSAFEIGMKGFSGPYEMSIDLRWPTLLDVIPETVRTFSGIGVKTPRFTIPPEIDLRIGRLDQPIYITWAADESDAGVLEVNVAQTGENSPEFFAFDTDPNNPDTWTTLFQADGSPAVFYAAIYCRGGPPLGACCVPQDAEPGLEIGCFDDVPITSCEGARWLEGTSCAENLFDPPCGTHACCLPTDTTCENRTFDDCAEDCVTDFNPVSCEPVCVGGPNHHLPCADDTECGPDGLCEPDGLCRWPRTCGLMSCQLNGEFTGRPCDQTGPGQGAADCMTCSGSGEYCRPRCANGPRRGRPCEPDGNDCPNSSCDVGFDCPSAQTCVSDQVCGHDANLCTPRCARWVARAFCGEDGVSCPNFTCRGADTSCFDEGHEIACSGRCSLDPDFSCRFDSDCAPSLGVCEGSDADCPTGSHCLHDLQVCTGPVGCVPQSCCALVCDIRPECCDESPGQIWDSLCVAIAADSCAFRPGNNECWSTVPTFGAFEILLQDDVNDTLCTSESTSCTGSKFATNELATTPGSDPRFCCNKRGVDLHGAGTVWFKFQAAHTTARVQTCNTPVSETAVDSLIQVFRAGNISDNANDYDECNSLEVIGCNDDAGCGETGELSSLCVTDLTPGETYYIQMASSQNRHRGRYHIDVESPCPSDLMPPVNSFCAEALPLESNPEGMPFSLRNAVGDCAIEPALPAMTNDIWFDTQATCTGNMIVQTCESDIGQPSPDTTLAVYDGLTCPPVMLVGANDDATLKPDVCSIGRALCESDEDCIRGCTGLGTPCENDDDCPGNSVCDTRLLKTCETIEGGFGESSGGTCFFSSDCGPGLCEPDLEIPCVPVTTFGYCRNGSRCFGGQFCPDGRPCEGDCGLRPSGTPWPCSAQEACVPGDCGSACSPASYVSIPVSDGQFFKIRLGGSFGSEPEGTIRVSCETDDCNGNQIPDSLDIRDGTAPDCNLNEEPDECDINSGFSNDCDGNGVPDDCEVDGGGPLLPGVQYAAGDRPKSVAISDLDGDLVPDLAVTNSSDDTVSVLLGVGDGTFAGAVNYPAGNLSGRLAIGDLNGDQVPDLAVTNSLSDGVSVLLGAGDGTFAGAVHYSAGVGPVSVAIGDLDGDLVPDLVVTNFRTDSVSVLLGVGNGTFFAAVNYAAGNGPRSLAIGDLDGDQLPDLAVANAVSDNISVLLGVGNGMFAVAVNFPAANSGASVAISDLDGDQVPDLAATNIADNSVSVLIGVGDGSFTAAVEYSAGDSPVSVAIGDLDGDQVPDLAVANQRGDNVTVLLGCGDGTFVVRVDYATGVGPISVAIGDLDGDHVPDLAVANFISDTVSVLLNQSSGGCNGNAIPDECDLDCGPAGGPCDRPGCGHSEDCNGNAVPDECEADCDSDGDGFLDDCDACIHSDLAKLIVFEECPTGVPNEILDDGCTMTDVLNECSVSAHSHGELTACVARQANEWRRQGLVSGKDVGHIVSCAATSNEHRPSKRIKDVRSHGQR